MTAVLIPFILGPQATTFISYLILQTNFISRPYNNPSKTFPFFVDAVVFTGDWKAILLSVLNFAICTALYYPFFKAYEARIIAAGEENAKHLALEEGGELKITSVSDSPNSFT